MKNIFAVAIAAACAFAFLVVPALADTAVPSGVTVPWGDDVISLLGFVQRFLAVILTGVLALGARFVPAALQSYNTTANRAVVEQLLEKAVDFGINKVSGAAKGQTLSVNVGSAVLAEAAQYAVDHGPAQIIAWAGGADSLMEKILARLNLEPGADGASVLANAAAPTTSK